MSKKSFLGVQPRLSRVSILTGELFSPTISTFFSRNFSIFHIFLVFFFTNIGMLTNLMLLVLEKSTTTDRTPPYIDTYLHLFPNLGNYGENALRQE